MEHAARMLQLQLQHRPEAAHWWYRLGHTQAARGQTDEARHSLNQVLACWEHADPDAPERVGAQSLLTSLSS